METLIVLLIIVGSLFVGLAIGVRLKKREKKD
jgi:uncharacterized protein YneF (UPF0154 family)